MWNLKKLYKCIYTDTTDTEQMHNRNRLTECENKLMITAGNVSCGIQRGQDRTGILGGGNRLCRDIVNV